MCTSFPFHNHRSKPTPRNSQPNRSQAILFILSHTLPPRLPPPSSQFSRRHQPVNHASQASHSPESDSRRRRRKFVRSMTACLTGTQTDRPSTYPCAHKFSTTQHIEAHGWLLCAHLTNATERPLPCQYINPCRASQKLQQQLKALYRLPLCRHVRPATSSLSLWCRPTVGRSVAGYSGIVM